MSSYYEKLLATGEVKCIDEEVPFDVPQGWEWCKINNIAFVTKLAGFEYTKYIAGNLKTNGIPLFKGKNVQGGKIIYEFEAYIPESLSDELERSQISKKCLLTPYVGTIGNIGLHNKSGKFHLGSNVGKIEILNPASQVCILEEFVHIYLLSQYGFAELTKYKKATAQESISIEAIRDVLLPIPPTQEQQKIVDKYYQLETFADKYSKLQGCLDKLNTEIFGRFKKSVLQEAIQGKLVPQLAEEGTAQELLEQIKTEKQKLVKEGKLKKSVLKDSVIFKGDDNKYYEKMGKKCLDITEEIPFEIPASWAWCHLNDIAESDLGKTMNKGQNSGELVPYLCSINVYWNKIDLSKIKQAQFTEIELAKYLLQKNDLLICEGGDIGRAAIWDINETMYYQNALHRVRFYGKIFPKFFLYILSLYKALGLLDKKSKGMTIKHFTKTALNSIVIPLPPLLEQKRIIEKMELLMQLLK